MALIGLAGKMGEFERRQKEEVRLGMAVILDAGDTIKIVKNRQTIKSFTMPQNKKIMLMIQAYGELEDAT